MWGGSAHITEAEGTCMISARRFTNSCHFRMISEGTSIECARLALRSTSALLSSFDTDHSLVRSDGVNVPRTVKRLLEEFDATGRRLLFCEQRHLCAPKDGSGANCRNPARGYVGIGSSASIAGTAALASRFKSTPH